MTDIAIETFIEGLRRRPWLEPDWIAVIAHGLRTAACDPDPSLWERILTRTGDEGRFAYGHRKLASVSYRFF